MDNALILRYSLASTLHNDLLLISFFMTSKSLCKVEARLYLRINALSLELLVSTLHKDMIN